MTHRTVDAVRQQIAAAAEERAVARILPLQRPQSAPSEELRRPPAPAPVPYAATGNAIRFIGVSFIALVATWFAARAYHGDAWLEPHRSSVQPDTTVIAVPSRENIAGLRPGEIELTLTDEEGRVVRVAAQRTAVSNFERELLFFLKRREETATQTFARDVKAAFDAGFADSETALNAYADFFFAWQRSWVLMKEAVLAGGSQMLNILSPGKIWEAVTARTRGYLMENYEARVLKPNERNPKIQKGLETAFQKAHAQYRATVLELDAREQAFIKKHTRLLEAYPVGSVTIKLDWQAQRWRIPAHLAEDRAEQAYRSVAIMGASVALTPLLTPVLNRIGASIMQRVAGRVVVARKGQIVGALVAVESIGLSLVVGAAIDWAVNKVDAKLNRQSFIDEHRKALGETRAGWESLANDQLGPVVARWWSDTRQTIVILNDNKE